MSLPDRMHESPAEQSQTDTPYHIDALTGLPTREWLNYKLEREIADNPGGFSLLFIDVDDLKRTNDSSGHAAGDALIKNAAEGIVHSLRTADTDDKREHDVLSIGPQHPHDGDAARLGGDEIVALVHETDSRQLGFIIDRINANLARKNVRASIGGRAHRPGESASELLASADNLMLAVKKQRKVERRRAEVRALPRLKRAAYHAAHLLDKYHGLPPVVR